MNRRNAHPPAVLANSFSNWASPRQRPITYTEPVYKEISPEKTINGRQTTAEVWAPNYLFHIKSQTAIMDSDIFRVRLYECVKKHVSTVDNAPPNSNFWRELIAGGHSNEDVMYCGRRNLSQDRPIRVPHPGRRERAVNSHGHWSPRRNAGDSQTAHHQSTTINCISVATQFQDEDLPHARSPSSSLQASHLSEELPRPLLTQRIMMMM